MLYEVITGTIVAIPTAITSCAKDDAVLPSDESTTFISENSGSCDLSPSETAGPFPIKTPAQLVRENIIASSCCGKELNSYNFV